VYKIARVEAVSIHRFEVSSIDLPINSNVWMILGRNLDSSQADSNGAGKTGFLNLLSYALTGSIPGKGAEIMTIGGSGTGSVEVVLLHDESKTAVRVVRATTKSGTKLHIYQDNKELEGSGEGLRKPQEILNRILGLPDTSQTSFEAFLNSVYLSFDYVRNFADVDTTSADRLALLTKFLSLDPLDIVIKDLRKERRDVDSQAESLRGALVEVEQVLEGYSLDALSNDLKEHELMLPKYEKKREAIYRKLSELPDTEATLSKEVDLRRQLAIVSQRTQAELEPLKREFDKAAARVEAIPELEKQKFDLSPSYTVEAATESVELARKKSNECYTLQSEVQSNLGTIKSALTSLLNTMSGLKCPECQTPLALDNNELCFFDLSRHKELIDLKEKELKLENDRLSKVCQRITDTQSECDETNSNLQAIIVVWDTIKAINEEIEEACSLKLLYAELSGKGEKLAEELRAEEEKINKMLITITADLSNAERVKTQKEQLNQQIKDIDKAVGEVRSRIVVIKERQDQANKITNRKNVIKEELRQYENQLQTYDRAILEVPKFRALELDQAVPEIEMLTNENLVSLGTDLRVQLKLEVKPNRTDFPILVSDEQGVQREYGTFSGGERQRIALACSFALRQLTQARGGFQLGFMMLDEVFDGLDSQGREALAVFLRNQPGQYFIISHGGLTELIPDSIWVTRENGVASFALKE